MDDKGITKLLEQVASDNDADLYLFSGPVAIKAEREFNQTLADNKQRKNALCLTTTYGGSADVAYQIVRAVRRCYPEGEFILFVDSICKSAGTLIALGADSIIMSDTAELGPLDVQVQRPGEMGEFISGLTPKQALATLRESAFEAFEFYFLNLRFLGTEAMGKLQPGWLLKWQSKLLMVLIGQFTSNSIQCGLGRMSAQSR